MMLNGDKKAMMLAMLTCARWTGAALVGQPEM